MAELPISPFKDKDTSEDRYSRDLLGFLNDAIQEGEAFLKAQKGYSKIEESINAIMSTRDAPRSSQLSSTRTNRIAKVSEDLTALLTDVRPFWEYKTAPGSPYEATATNLGRISDHWYKSRQIDLRFADAIRYWSVAGTGYTHQFWNTDTLDNDMTAEDPRDVLPLRPVGYETLQTALGVAIRRERTTNYIKQVYGVDVTADREGAVNNNSSRTSKLLEKIGSPFWDHLTKEKVHRDLPKIPTVDLFTVYLRDDRRNKRPYPVQIGQFDSEGKPENNWSYIVDPGQPLYPRKRCIEFTHNKILYDGPSIYWHGMFPVSKLTLNPWPWSWLGKAPLWDLLSLQEGLDETLQIIHTQIRKIGRPAVIADKNSMSEAALRKVDTQRAGQKYRINPLAGKGIEIEREPPIDQSLVQHVEWLKAEMQECAGVKDLSQLMQLNQLPSDDSMSKMIESMTPGVRSRSRILEAFMREFATIAAYNFMQFYTLPMRMAILGPYAATPEDFDYDPGTMIPDYVHRSDFGSDGHPTPEALVRGPLPRLERAQEYMMQFQFNVAPGSLLSASEIERRMLYLQLARAGWIDQTTTLEVLGIPNIKQIRDRLQQDQMMGIGMNNSPAGATGGSGTGGAGAGAGGDNAGRKASGQAPPRQVVKES